MYFASFSFVKVEVGGGGHIYTSTPSYRAIKLQATPAPCSSPDKEVLGAGSCRAIPATALLWLGGSIMTPQGNTSRRFAISRPKHPHNLIAQIKNYAHLY